MDEHPHGWIPEISRAPLFLCIAKDDLSFEMNYDPITAQRIREIAMAKEQAVEMEDYDTAKRLKVMFNQKQRWGWS